MAGNLIAYSPSIFSIAVSMSRKKTEDGWQSEREPTTFARHALSTITPVLLTHCLYQHRLCSPPPTCSWQNTNCVYLELKTLPIACPFF